LRQLGCPRKRGIFTSADEWQYSDVDFHGTFTETPVILLTGFGDASVSRYAPASVGVVFNATRFGFTLGARNIEGRDGQTGFYWVALGCGEGCG
jgi:hypothetical protein